MLDLAYLAKNIIDYLDSVGEKETTKEIYKLVLLMGNEEQKKEAEFYLAKLSYGSLDEMEKQDGRDKMQWLASEDYPPALMFLGFLYSRELYADKNRVREYYEKALNSMGKEEYREYKERDILWDIYNIDYWEKNNRKNNYHLLEKAKCDENVLDEDDDIALCSINLAEHYVESGKYDKAKDIYERILRYDSDNIFSLSGLGDIYYKGLGERQDLAKEYYGKACDLKYQEACDLFREVNEKIR
ncbi:hypothetical protein BKK51_00660 [Rodentibacter trehalosifermentans]|uniref:Uncharacterized protein n=1 Tax=Rodentibacter trehalosifermentans TaxID=1908263 RepID=A0A1V3IXX9_9PAST|nr:hypothetical protein [Rodentibacter trehalosifermentans]OOF47207.1 hypothetical protein BKK51_00660 [Rodentibacter trehalosifermentans]